MRMWMCDPRILCKNHLLGEYRELFTFIGALKKKIKMDGYFRNNLFEPLSLESRYKQLKAEMIRRGYKPKKKFDFKSSYLSYLEDKKYNTIDKTLNLRILLGKCEQCKEIYRNLKKSASSAVYARNNSMFIIYQTPKTHTIERRYVKNGRN